MKDSRKLFLIQSYRDNCAIYQESIQDPSSVPVWDGCVLTASNEDQARAYELQLNARLEGGLLPRETEYVVIPDPEGKRIGSGGATLNALLEITRGSNKENPFAGKKILIIHSGGDSKRIPHYSAFGKIFSRIPRELPDGSPSTLFDEFIISLAGLPSRMKEGVLVVSGDVLLIFNHTQLDFEYPGVVGIGIKAPVMTGSQHGVYQGDEKTQRVRRFLHKQPVERLRAYGVVDQEEKVIIDSGMVWFDPEAAGTLLDLVRNPDKTINDKERKWWISEKLNLNLYGDFLFPLAEESTLPDYLREESEGQYQGDLQSARQKLWNRLHIVPFYVKSLVPAEFIHFGTTREYRDLLLTGQEEYRDLGWKQTVMSNNPGVHSDQSWVVMNSSISGSTPPLLHQVVMEDSRLEGDFSLGKGSLLSHVQYRGKGLITKEDIVIHQLPLHHGHSTTRMYGVFDNPKETIEKGTFCNQPWSIWFRKSGLTPDDLWDTAENPADRSLWNARLFPVSNHRDESLRQVLWMQEPEKASRDDIERWLRSERVSLKECTILADRVGIIREQEETEDIIRTDLFLEAIRDKKPFREHLPILGKEPKKVVKRLECIVRKTNTTADPLIRMRYYRAAAEIAKMYAGPQSPYRWRDLENQAFLELTELINHHLPSLPVRGTQTGLGLVSSRELLRPIYQGVSVSAAARADLGGGWSDTPPFSNENGGTVLNCALELRHELPIQVYARSLSDPALIFKSFDLNLEKKISSLAELLDFKNPADPLALHKAAVIFSGFIPEKETPSLSHFLGRSGGLELSTRVSIPKGSGLGISSILAAAMLICLSTLLGRPWEEKMLFEQVLALEQKLTTGGGWQDQVGGIVPGVKLITTQPGLPQFPEHEPVVLGPDSKRKMDEQFVILYTGQKRLAKGILRDMMSGYILAEPTVVHSLHEIKNLAIEMKEALLKGDLETLGTLMTRHWEMNKQMDPGCTNLLIDRIFEICSPFMYGGKLCGAGGGGFMELLAKDKEAVQELQKTLQKEFPEGDVTLWPVHITETPVVVWCKDREK